MTAALLDPQAAERLAKLLGLLGSRHDGEVLAAARKAHALVREIGCTWFDVIRISKAAYTPPLPRDWREMAMACRAAGYRLNPKEFAFVANMCMARFEPSEKQLAWLLAIHAKVRR